MTRAKDIPAANRALVASRSAGVCEGCGERPPSEVHHRKFRSRGGTHQVSNLLHLCGWGNHTGCHGVGHDGLVGESRGWSVRSGFNPAMVPVLYRKSWVLLSDDGMVTPVKEIQKTTT